jgi:imidazolonepropionase-like amidohydrolase
VTRLVRLRDLAGADHALVIDGDRFADPEDQIIEAEWDLRHLVALPGLADCHSHLAAPGVEEMVAAAEEPEMDLMRQHAAEQLDHGVLLLADKGTKSDAALAFLNEPAATRPELHMAGVMISTPGGYYPNFGLKIEPDELADAVADRTDTQAEFVKIVGDWPRSGVGPVPNFTQDQLTAACEVAHEAGKRVAIHTMAPDTPSLAVAAGVDSIEHGLFLTEDDVRALGDRGGAWVPTIAAVEAIIAMLGKDSSGGRLLRQGLENVRDLLPVAVDAGVAVLAGTDLALPHGEVSQEAVKLHQFGLSADQVVAALTTVPYRWLGAPHGLAPGMPADFVCIDGDPRVDLSLLHDPAVIVRAGTRRVG